MVRLTESACEPGVVRTWAGDQLVGHLLALHGVHPDPAQVRVQQVISEIQSQLPGGGAVEFAGIQDGVVQLDVSAGGCGTSGLVSSVREIVLGSVPDLADVEAKQGTSAFIPLEALHRQATR
jgi:hypothetical protein